MPDDPSDRFLVHFIVASQLASRELCLHERVEHWSAKMRTNALEERINRVR